MVKFKCWIWRKAIKIHHELMLYNELNRTIDYVCNICHTCLYFKSCADISMSLNLTGANVTPVSEWSNCLHERPLFLRILPRFEKIDENQFPPQIQCIQAVRDGPVAFGDDVRERAFHFCFLTYWSSSGHPLRPKSSKIPPCCDTSTILQSPFQKSSWSSTEGDSSTKPLSQRNGTGTASGNRLTRRGWCCLEQRGC